jgi:hypothetical protein
MELPGNGVHMPFVTCEIGWAPDFGAPIEAAQGFPNRASVEPCYSYAPAPSHNRRRPCHRGTREQSDCPAIRRQWSEDRHHAKLAGGDARYYVSEDDTGAIEAYVIPRGLNEDSRSIELKRIVVAVPSAAWADVSLTRLSAQHSVRSAHTGCFSTSRKTTPAPGTCMRASDSNTRESCAKRHTGMDAGSTCTLCRCSNPNTTDVRHSPCSAQSIYTFLDGNDRLWHGNRYAFPGGRHDRRTRALGARELANRRGHRLYCRLRIHGRSCDPRRAGMAPGHSDRH